MADELYDIRNTLMVGNYHQVIAEAASLHTVKKKKSDEMQAFNTDRDSLVARAQIGLGQFDSVINEFSSASHPLLVACARYAEVCKEMSNLGESGSSTKISALVQMAAEPKSDGFHPDIAILACSGHIHARDITAAMALASQWIEALNHNTHARQIIELKSIITEGYIHLNRPDLADKEVESMKKIDDESSLAILVGGIAALKLGATRPEKYQDAFSAFQEINARCGQSVPVLNLMALANIGNGNPQDAERNLLDALAKKSGDPDTISNLAMVSGQLMKPQDATGRCINQAKSALPLSPFARQYNAMELRFAEAADQI